MRIIRVFFLMIVFLFAAVPSAMAYTQVAKYTSPKGIEIISYSKEWKTQDKLKTIYNELLKNTYGKEIYLLSDIYIYPAGALQGENYAGHWFGSWEVKNGKYQLISGRYINLYHGDEVTDAKGFARVLAHEYGHHFTYYYYLKQENKPWEEWKKSGFAKARGITQNPYVGSSDYTDHSWLIEEIAAEDYVQLFGSPTAKESHQFYDIEQRAQSDENDITYSSEDYNLRPQENPLLGLAADSKAERDYWLKAMGQKTTGINTAPTPATLSLSGIDDIGADTKQYKFAWTPSKDDTTTDLEYTFVRYYYKPKEGLYMVAPVKSAYQGDELQAVFGAAKSGDMLYWDIVPKELQLFTVYTKDKEGLTVSSNTLAMDFANQDNPDYVNITPADMNTGKYFKPRVKINSRQLTFDVDPEITKGRTMVPLRKIFEELGANVTWDQATNSITATKDGKVIYLQINVDTADVNQQTVQLDAPPMLKNGRTLVPLRFVSEALGATVNWNANLQLVSISY